MGLYNRGTVESWKASLRNARHSGNLPRYNEVIQELAAGKEDDQ